MTSQPQTTQEYRDTAERTTGGSTTEATELAAALRRALATERVAHEVLETRARRQATIARLGREAVADSNLASTLELLVRGATTTLGVDFCSVVKSQPGNSTFTIAAAFGGRPAREGRPAECALSDAEAAYTLQASSAVASSDLRTETRFQTPTPVFALGAISGLSVALRGKDAAWGVLGVHSMTRRTFVEEDAQFLEAVGNLMALAIERDRIEVALLSRSRQQAAVAALGRRALAGPHMEDFFRDAVREIASTLDLELCYLLQRNGDAQALLLRSGVGWAPGMVGAARVPATPASHVGFTLGSDAPLIVLDVAADSRFEPSELLREHGVVSGMSVVVPGRHRPFGVLGAFTTRRREFTLEDTYFLQAMANLLAAAIERHAVEGDLRRHRDDLEGLVEERTALLAASNRELEAFSYTISHDLRAPLRSINGLGKIIQRKHAASLPPAAKELLVLMADETVRMGSLIESILTLSRLGTVSLTLAPFDLSRVANDVLETLRSRHPGRNVEWTIEPGLKATGDEALLRVLLDNLLGNAWKFTGHVAKARIQVGSEPDGFWVKDNGAGFDMAHARELFQPFHRLHAADEFEGTGIGLATVSRIVARHGGQVSAVGVPGQGATIHVILPPPKPLQPGRRPHGAHEPSEPTPHAIAVNGGLRPTLK